MSTGERQEERYAPAVERVYRTEELDILWEPSRCIHFGECVRGSVAAFDPRRRPWIDPTAEPAERLVEIIARCPTGALHAVWHDGRPTEQPPEITAIEPTLDGPLFVRGRIQIFDRQGNLVRQDTRMALCRCGHSQNKPFCDDSHYRVGFQSLDPRFDGPAEAGR